MLPDFIKAVVERFPEDPSAPSVVFSFLKDKNAWYVAVVRYKSKFGKDKFNVSSFMHEDLDYAITHLYTCFMESYVAS